MTISPSDLILPDDTPVDLDAEFKDSHIEEVLSKLDRELVGLMPVKTRIRETAALLLVDRVRKKLNLSAISALRYLLRTKIASPTISLLRYKEINLFTVWLSVGQLSISS